MKVIGVIVLVAIAYFLWRFVIRGDGLVLIGQDTGKRVTASLMQVVPNESLVIEIDNNDKRNAVTVISMPRNIAETLGVSPPEGFAAELMPLTEKEKKDKETVEFAEKYNAETLRWAGRLELAPNGVSVLRIPAKNTSELSGRIDFQYEAKVALGGSLSFFSLALAPPAPNQERFQEIRSLEKPQ